jgi:seryl-tRNA synthetase
MLDITLLRKDFKTVKQQLAKRYKDYPQLDHFQIVDTK